MRSRAIAGLIVMVIAIFFVTGRAFAPDPPHFTDQNVQCSSCHLVHKASGTSLTKNASNANLCLSCHTADGLADAKRLAESMRSTPGTEGSSHSWGSGRIMPSTNSPDNQYGLRWSTGLSSGVLKGRLKNYGYMVTCSVCHAEHSQAKTAWSPFAPAYTTVTKGWTTDGGRKLQRITNEYNEMCEDCHYYRTTAWLTNVRTWTSNYLSHPVTKIFTTVSGRNVSDPAQFNDAPLEWTTPALSWATWGWQSGARYHLNSGNDTDLTNNIVVDPSGQIRCLSCHGVHYTDSDGSTVDEP